jgi:hypothetical protein
LVSPSRAIWLILRAANSQPSAQRVVERYFVCDCPETEPIEPSLGLRLFALDALGEGRWPEALRPE